MNSNLPKYENGQVIRGKNVGTFVVCGSRFSAVIGEWIYEVREVSASGKLSRPMNLVESCFA